MRNWLETREREWVPHALWSLAGLGWAFWITLRPALQRQVFEGGSRPVRLFVNTTITFPQQKLESPFHILFLLGGISRISPFSAIFLQRVFGRFGHRFFVPLAPWCLSSPHTQKLVSLFESLYCYVLGKGSWEQGNPGRGKGWDGEIGVLGVKLVMMSMLRFLGFGLFRNSKQLLIVQHTHKSCLILHHIFCSFLSAFWWSKLKLALPYPCCFLALHTNPEVLKIGEKIIALAVLQQLYRYKKAPLTARDSIIMQGVSPCLYCTIQGARSKNKGLRLARDGAGQPGAGGRIGWHGGHTGQVNKSEKERKKSATARARTPKSQMLASHVRPRVSLPWSIDINNKIM